MRPSHGGLEVERWSDNRTDSASVGSNPALGMLCRSSSNRKVIKKKNIEGKIDLRKQDFLSAEK